MSGVKARDSGTPARRYQSPLREQSARRTRQAIVRAAHELFTARGYAATSLADIAAAAGVARPTAAAAFGSKPALLRQVLDQALAGDDEPVPVAQRPWFRPVWDASTPAAALDAYARVGTLINSRAARIFEVVRRAADQAPEIAQLWDTLQRNRRAGARMVTEHAASLGPLAAGLGIDRATDILWVFNDPAHYDALVTRCGWPEHDYTSWLSSQIRHALLPPDTRQITALRDKGDDTLGNDPRPAGQARLAAVRASRRTWTTWPGTAGLSPPRTRCRGERRGPLADRRGSPAQRARCGRDGIIGTWARWGG